MFFILLTTAGNETTRHTISLGLIDLLTHPRRARPARRRPRARGHRGRRAPPPRASRAPLPPHRDARCRAPRTPDRGGDKVTIWYAGANYDEEKFADPYRLDVGRTPNRHVTFGLGGPHFCLGAHLAKLESRSGSRRWSPTSRGRAGRDAGAATLELLQRDQAAAGAGARVTTREEAVAHEDDRGHDPEAIADDLAQQGCARFGCSTPTCTASRAGRTSRRHFAGMCEEGVTFCAAVMGTDLAPHARRRR